LGIFFALWSLKRANLGFLAWWSDLTPTHQPRHLTYFGNLYWIFFDIGIIGRVVRNAWRWAVGSGGLPVMLGRRGEGERRKKERNPFRPTKFCKNPCKKNKYLPP